MFLQCIIIALAQFTEAVDLTVNAEVSFDIKITNLDLPVHKYRSVHVAKKTKDSDDVLSKTISGKNVSHHVRQAGDNNGNVTAGPLVECVYQYPEPKQMNAILSNMMNELTKVFIHARDFLEGQDERRSLDKRFKIVGYKNTTFFESIFSNMTQEYNTFYNSTAERVSRSGRDPCLHQEEIKEMWRQLLEYSLSLFRRSALNCIEEYLKSQNKTYGVSSKNKLSQFLKKQIAKIKFSQLNTLCDEFQLCYNEFL